MEISIFQLIRLAWKKWYIIVAVALLVAIVAGVFVAVTAEPQYRASTKIYLSTPQNDSQLSSSQSNAIRDMMETYSDFIMLGSVLDAVRAEAGVNYSNNQLQRMISITKNGDSLIFTLSVTAGTAEEAVLLANTIADCAIPLIRNSISTCEGRVVDPATKEMTANVSTSAVKFAMIGFILGACLAYAVLLLNFILDTTVRKKDDLKEISDLPIIGLIPSFAAVDSDSKKKGEIR